MIRWRKASARSVLKISTLLSSSLAPLTSSNTLSKPSYFIVTGFKVMPSLTEVCDDWGDERCLMVLSLPFGFGTVPIAEKTNGG
jgi:hypothetical protein